MTIDRLSHIDAQLQNSAKSSMPSKPPASESSSLPSKIFQRGVHDCSFCGFELSRSAPSCPRCQCTLLGLDSVLGNDGPSLKTVMDFSELLTEGSKAIHKSIASSEKKFPQIKLMFCSIACPEGIKPTSLGWWMLNRGINSSDLSWTGLLLVDPKLHQVTFQTGYDLEVFINRQKLEALLSECGDWFTLGNWSGGVVNFFIEIQKLLKQAHRDALTTRKQALKVIGKK